MRETKNANITPLQQVTVHCTHALQMSDSDQDEPQMPCVDHNEREAVSRKRAFLSEPIKVEDKKLCPDRNVINDVNTKRELGRDEGQIDDQSPYEKSSTVDSGSDHEIVDENFSEDDFGMRIEHIDADECAFLYQVLHNQYYIDSCMVAADCGSAFFLQEIFVRHSYLQHGISIQPGAGDILE